MASLVSGISFLESFGFYAVVFPLILIMALVYGILSQVKPFGDDKSINIIVSLVVAFMMISVAPAVNFVRLMIPYIAVFFVMIVFILMLFQFMGVKSDVMQEAFNHPAVYGVILVIILIGTFLFLSESFPELKLSGSSATDSTSSSSGGSNDYNYIDDGTTIIESDGSTTVIVDGGGSSSTNDRRDLLRNTVFHPTILALLIITVVFGAAVYMIAIVDRQ